MTVTRPSKFVGICCVLAMMPAIVGCPTQSPPPAAQPKGESADHKDDVDFSGPPPEYTEEELAEQARMRQEYEEFLERLTTALSDGTVQIHRVYNYPGTPPFASSSSPRKMIGVDIELDEGLKKQFGYVMLHVLDGVTGKSYGGPVDGAYMSPEGTIQASQYSLLQMAKPDKPGSVRALVVYALPTDSSNSITLSYDSHVLTPKPLVISGEGPTIQ